VRYWRARGKGYSYEFAEHDQETAVVFDQQERVLVGCLGDLHFSSALEIGCGFGRILRLLSDHFQLRRLEGLDISPDQLQHAREYVRQPWIALKTADITSPLKYTDREFDLVLTCEVLMHIPEPLPVLKEMVRVSNRYVVNLEYFDPSAKALSPWVFSHDLVEMYQTLLPPPDSPINFPITTIQLAGNQRIVLLTKKSKRGL
jgi:ubiquinone/menaquinone biosynthesis C-methylase UbiE